MPRDGVCGFCAVGGDTNEGQHSACRRAIRNGNGAIMICMCESPFHGGPVTPFCTECYSKDQEGVDPKLYLCWDRETCEAKVEERVAKNPAMQQIRQANEKAVLRMIAEGRRSAPRVKSEPKPKTGKCLCCGETTGGGKFLPGHDARLLSRFVTSVREGEKKLDVARSEFAALGVSDALLAKFDKRVA